MPLRHRIALWRARRTLRQAQSLLRRSVIEIDRHAIVSPEAAALYRAWEAYASRMGKTRG